MKKLLGIVVLSLLLNGNVFADGDHSKKIKKWQNDPEGRKKLALSFAETGTHNVEAYIWFYIISKTNPEPALTKFMNDIERLFLNQNELALAKMKANEWLKKNQ